MITANNVKICGPSLITRSAIKAVKRLSINVMSHYVKLEDINYIKNSLHVDFR